MNLNDYRFLIEVAYGEWKRRHAVYLDLSCRIAGGAIVPMATVAAARADVERAMADLASMSHQTVEQDEFARDRDVVPGFAAMLATAGSRAMVRLSGATS